MKKVYLIRALLKEGKSGSIVTEVFTNKSKARAYCDYFNSSEDANYYYYVQEQTICEYDFRSVPY